MSKQNRTPRVALTQPPLSQDSFEMASPIMQTSSVPKEAAAKLTSKEVVSNDKLWTVHGSRYDLRSFVSCHPGGVHAIELGMGIDCTTLFESYHPFTQHHRVVLASYKYDDSPDSTVVDDCFDWEKTPFWNDLKDAARKYFSPRGDESTREIIANTKATWSAWAKHGLGMFVVVIAFYGWLHNIAGLWSILYFPAMYWLFASDLMHNGSHFCVLTIPWVNAVCAYIGSFHTQYHCWALQHVVGHHVHTNIVRRDPDLCHFQHITRSEIYLPGFRVHHHQKVHWKYKPLWKFALAYHLVLSTLAMALVKVPGWVAKRRVDVTHMPERMVRAIKVDRAVLVAACVAYAWRCDSIGAGIFKMFWSWAVHGILFLIFSQISHVNEECMNGAEIYRQKHELEKNEWASHQVLSAYDYSCDSKLVTFLAVNLNQQICHHLFPGVHPCHYPALRRIFLPIAAKYGIDYEARSSDNLFVACKKTLRWICRLNDGELNEPYCTGIFGLSGSTFWGLALTIVLFSALIKPALMLTWIGLAVRVARDAR